MTFGREPLTIVEIDVDRCTRTYGSAPCTASLSVDHPRKCYNTFQTCQDLENYDRGTVTLRFARNQSGLPKIAGIYPALTSVSDRASEINLSGIDPTTTALGKRARVEVTLQDFVDDDNFTDLYQAERVSGAAQFSGVGYDTKRGTFFGKWLARTPYYIGRALRVKRGYVGDDISAMHTAHYVISEWKGPNAAGVVQITAKDVLDLVDNKKAVVPQPSNGKLLAALTAVATTATLTPTGIGDDEYPASGRVAIGREIATFTRSGDVLTFTERGVDGTAATTHNALDVVQVCKRYEDERACDIINDLLTVEGPVDAAFIPFADWEDEEDSWLGGTTFSATIAKPTGIAQLVGEVCQHGLILYWDEVDQEIKFRVNRPIAPGETVEQYTDAANFIESSLDLEYADDQRVSAIYFWHGTIDPTEDPESSRNYSKLVISLDVSATTEQEYGESRIKTIYSRWFGQYGNDAFAAIIAERLVSRYRDTPRLISGTLDVKDEGIRPADIIDITTYLAQDATGDNTPTRVQIKQVERKEDRLVFKAETWTLAGRFGFWLDDAVDELDYDSATDLQKAEGAWWFDEAEDDFGDQTGPYVYF